MGDDEERRALVAHDAQERLDDLELDEDVERGRRLVRDDELGATGQRGGDRGALEHAARQLVWVAAHEAGRVGNPEAPEQIGDPLAPPRSRRGRGGAPAAAEPGGRCAAADRRRGTDPGG